MKKINTKFIAGMLAMALVFGMAFASCEQETVTKEVLVAGPGSTTTVEVEGYSFAANEKALIGYLNDTRTKPIYVVSNFTVAGNLTVPTDKTIVVTDDSAIRAKAVTAGALSQNRGVLFAIGSLGNNAPVLTVKGRLTVQDGGKVVLGSETAAQWSGKLEIADGGKVLVKPKGTIITTTSSEIALEDATSSTLSFEDKDAKLVVVGSITGGTVVGTDHNTAIIVSPAEPKDLTIGIGNVTIGSSAATDTQLGGSSFTGSTQTVSGGSLTDTTLDAGKTLVVSGNATVSGDLEVSGTLEVTGSLTTSGELKVEEGGALKVEGSLTTSGELEVKGTLEVAGSLTTSDELTVADGGTLKVEGNLTTSGTLTVGEEATLEIAKGATITVAEDGALDLSALYDTDEEEANPVALEGELVVADGGTLTLSMGDGTGVIPEIDWDAGGSLKIESGGNVTLDGGDNDLTYIGTKSTTATENYFYRWDDSTGSVTLSDGKFELDGNVTLYALPVDGGGTRGDTVHTGTTVTVKSGAKLTVSDTWYQVDGTLEILGTVKLADGESTGAQLFPHGQVIIREGGTLEVGGKSGISYSYYEDAPGEQIYSVLLKVAASNNLDVATKATLATATGTPPVHTLTTANDWSDGTPSSTSISVILGQLKLASPAEPPTPATSVITGDVATSGGGAAAAGILKAGSGTTLIFTAPVAAE
jgi:cytoskeletal protein CcmA (bactofilin family)